MLTLRSFSVCALSLALLLGGLGCMTTHRVTKAFKESLGLAQPNPAALLITTFEPSLYHLPDPTRDGQLRPGLAGMMYLVDKDGQFTDVNGTFTVFIEDITPRPQGVPSAVPEAWEFDSETLKRLKSNHEKFGKNTVIFLPWPDNWKSVTTLRISTKYDPNPTAGGVQLTGPVQPLTVDFNSPGRDIWTKTNEPFVMRGIPNMKKDLAKGFSAANSTMPQMAAAAAPVNPGMLNTGVTLPPANTQMAPLQNVPQQPLSGMTGAIPLQGNAAKPNLQQATGANTLPELPPTIVFDPRNPTVNTQVGQGGALVRTTAMALPTGQSVPAGWVQLADKSIVPAVTKDPGIVALPQPAQPAPSTIQVPINWPAAPVSTVPNTPPQQVGFDPRSTVGSWASTPGANGTVPIDPNAQLKTVTIPAGNR